MLWFASQVLVRGVRRPITWGPDFVEQYTRVLRVCAVPLMLTSFALAFGPVGVQASGFLQVFGSFDRFGAIYALVEVRLFAPLVVGIVVAGAAGTAVCADLGARVVREEVAALEVLGVDPVRSLAAPRVAAIVVTCVLFYIVAVIAGLLGALLVLHQHHQPVGPAVANFFSNVTPLELQAATLKCLIYGAVIALVSCYKGLNVSGGAEGVGRAVNQSVVIAFVAIGFIDYAFTQLLLATNPLLSQVRG